MKKIFLSACLLSLFMAHAHAQETYENTKLIDNDLNGTARYVGMGGAMEALGADISVINSNPAGIGLFRRSSGSVSFGLVSQDGASSFKYGNKTNASFDQAGFVYSLRDGRRTFINFGFNYHKSKNFDYILNAASALNGASQHKLSYMKALANENNLDKTSSGWRGKFAYTSQLDNLYYNTLMMTSSDGFFYNDASGYEFGRAETGYIGEYDFNTSVNVNDRVYLGITIGIHDVHYTGHSLYNEALVNLNNQTAGDITVNDERRITGTGYNASFGIIFRPVDASPFRIGLSVSTPTWYDLKTSNYTYLINNTKADGGGKLQGDYPNYTTGESYEFKLFTPWKFGVSLGHTVGNYLALGATYEYSDYQDLETRVNDGGVYDYYYDDWYDKSTPDRPMNRHTKETLKGVSTVKLGAEYKPIPTLAMRIGYNYVSPMYDKNGFKDGSIDSYGSNYATMTDYTNWKGTNRLTLGLGYTVDKVSIDLAYQYTTQKGDFYPFMNSWADYHYIDDAGIVQTEQIDNYATKTEVKDSRHQLLLTLGYHF